MGPSRTGRRPGALRPAASRLAALLSAALLLGGCAKAPPTQGWEPVPEAEAEAVDAVAFLIGDAGEALPGSSPVLLRLAAEVEAWSERLQRDSAVSVLYLGDIVYPDGVHDRTHPSFREDSLHVQAQVDVVRGDVARRWRTAGIFIAGNHDWGQMAGPPGVARLENLEALLDAMAAEQGVAVDLLPEAGDPGPYVLDAADRVRFLLLDTHWWLQTRNDAREDSVVMAVGEAIAGAGEREIVLAAHHPFVSGGSHGGPMPIWEGLGILYLLRKTGSLIQDLNSLPYREFRLGLRALFGEIRRPLLWAGGHDHSLQVIEGIESGQPLWNVVSGSGSKLTDVAPIPGMRFGADVPGYMRLTFLESGEVHLHVFGAGDEYLHCDGDDMPVETCLEEGPGAFHVIWAGRLR